MSSQIAAEKFAAELIGRPLAMSPDAAALAFEFAPSRGLDARAPLASAADAPRPYALDGGIAVIPICGQTVNRPSWLTDLFGFPSYHGIARALSAAVADPQVRGVLLEFDSPGGEFAGAVELAAEVRRASARKPVVALVDSLAASAAYIVAAGAQRIYCTMSATVGSIGVVWLHLDRSGALAKQGVKPTLIHAGARKVDGHSYQALAPEAEKAIRGQIHQAHELMLKSIGAHRPALGVSRARATEAGVYIGQKAVDAGLADAVGTYETARAYLLAPAPTPAARAGAPGRAVHSPSSSASSHSTVIGTTAMPQSEPQSTVSPTLAALLRPLPGGHPRSPEAVRRIVRKAERIDAGNAIFSRQTGGHSADEFWRDGLAKAGALDRRAEPAPAPAPAKAAVADPWDDILAKPGVITPISECHR